MRKLARLAIGIAAVTVTLTGASAGFAQSAATVRSSWTAPRTPWGDPDLQGNYSNKYEFGTPFERPATFEGRRLEDITGAELSRLVQERAVEVLLNSPFSGGDPIAGNFGGAPAFYDRFEANKGSRPWLVVDPPDGRVPAMTPEGQQASAARAAARAALRTGRGPADSYSDRSLYDRCITRGFPGSMMPVNYGNSYSIVQSPGYVAITYEMVHDTRIIPLDGRPPLSSTFRPYMGEARGRWDGDTLVVETTNFREDQAYRGANPDTLRIVERFTPTAPGTVEWSVTIVDPSSWPRPWTFAMPLTKSDQEAVLEYACHEGNRAMANLLSAARAEESVRATRTDAAPRPGAPAAAGASAPVRASAPAPAPGKLGIGGAWTAGGAGGRVARTNFAGFSTPSRIVITERPTDVVVETDTGTEGQMTSAVYKLDGSENDAPGPIGWDTRARVTSQDSGLVVAIKRTIAGPDGPLTFDITEKYSVSGDTLTLERTQGSRSQRTVYTRQQ